MYNTVYIATTLSAVFEGVMRIYAYLSASTEGHDASRAKNELEGFANELGKPVSAWFIENESGTKLNRPELMKLIDIV